MKRNVEQWLGFMQKASRKRSGAVVCHKLNMSQQCHCCKSTFQRNQNSFSRGAAITSHWLCCLQVTWCHPAVSCCSWHPWESSVPALGHWSSREKVEWLSGLDFWGWLPWRSLPGAVRIGFKGEICSLYSWCKKLNQVERLNSEAGRIWEDSLRGCGVCLTASRNRQVGSVGFRESFGALFPMDYHVLGTYGLPCVGCAGSQPFCEGKGHHQQLWPCCEPQTRAHQALELKQDAAAVRQTEMRGNVLCLCFCTAPVQMVVCKGFIKSPCLFAPAAVHIQGCHGGSVPVCWELCLHLWFLWGSAYVLTSCHGWDWGSKAVGGCSLCRKCRQESLTDLLRAWFAAFLIWRQCLFPLLLPPLPLCWHHVMFTGPQSDPSQCNELS